jgi:ABC-2 type transport system permease protein
VQRSEPASGSIYDLGYRRYDGPRLGRRHAFAALYWHSLRSAFGLGRRASSKVIPIGLALLTLVPAVIQLGIAAIAANVVEVYRAENYYGFIQVTLSLFCAAVAPELVGRDQRTHTLSLYFSRSLLRSDYALAKLAAFATAFLLLTVGPQTVLFVGNAFAGNDTMEYMRDNWHDIPRVLVTATAISLLFASLGLAIAAQTPRRAYSTGAIIFAFSVMWVVGQVTVQATDETYGRFALLVSPLHVVRGTVLWVFDVSPERGGTLALADFDLAVYGLACIAAIGVSALVLLRRYERISA